MVTSGRVFCIASGGETAFDLLLAGAREVVAVDVNPAQVALVELKSRLFRCEPPSEILRTFGNDARPFYKRSRGALSNRVTQYFDGRTQDLAHGLVHSGKIDRDMRRAMRLFQRFVQPKRRVLELLGQPNLEAQTQIFEQHWKGVRLRLGIKLAFSPFVLKRVFGSQFGSVPVAGFGEMIRADLETVASTTDLRSNPYVWQSLVGQYPPTKPPDWLTPFGLARMGLVISRLGLEVADAAEWLSREREPSFRLACLSNVLELTDEAEKRRMVEGLSRAMLKGSKVVCRSLFDAPIGLDKVSDGRLRRLPTENRIDRSLLCRNVELYEWQGG